MSKFTEKNNMSENFTESTIETLIEWENKMVKNNFCVFFFLFQINAGTNFEANELKNCAMMIFTDMKHPKHVHE